MSATGDSPRTRPTADAAPGRPASGGNQPHRADLDQVCPYLFAGSGSWRETHPSRDQACWAADPVVLLPPAKQRDLCLVAAHRSCATFAAAQAAASARPSRPSPGDDGAALWPTIRPTPVVLDPENRLPRLPASRTRAGGQIVLVGVMIVAFLVLVVARTSGPGGAATASPSASAAAVAALPSPTATPMLTPSPSPIPSASPSASSATPSETAKPAKTPRPSPSTGTRYRVKSGDTLSSIAIRFGTTVRVLKRLNGITDVALIRPGQVLIVP